MNKKPEIKFIFNELKATQAAYFLLMAKSGILPDYSLLRLLYFTDRIMILCRDRSLTGDQPILTHAGVSLLNIQKLINNKNSLWYTHISNAQGCLNANRQNPPGDSELSKYEKYILEFVVASFGLVPNGWYYQNLLPEYQYYLPSSDTKDPVLVDPAYIIRAAATCTGENPENTINNIKEDLKELKFISSLGC